MHSDGTRRPTAYNITLVVVLCLGMASLGVLVFELTAKTVRATPAGSPLLVSPATFDFGKVPEGMVAAHFSLQNTSRRPIRVLRVQKSCDCADVSVPSVLMQPGEDVGLDCRWDLRDRIGTTTTSLGLWLGSDEPKDGVINRVPVRVALSADVQPLWQMTPSSLTFSRSSDHDNSKTISVVASDDSAITIKAATCKHDAFDTSVDSVSRTITVRFKPDKWLLAGPARLYVTTDNVVSPQKTIPIYVER
jgi:hypothetical protein